MKKKFSVEQIVGVDHLREQYRASERQACRLHL